MYAVCVDLSALHCVCVVSLLTAAAPLCACPPIQINKVFGGDVPVLQVGQEELTAVCKRVTDIDGKVRN